MNSSGITPYVPPIPASAPIALPATNCSSGPLNTRKSFPPTALNCCNSKVLSDEHFIPITFSCLAISSNKLIGKLNPVVCGI